MNTKKPGANTQRRSTRQQQVIRQGLVDASDFVTAQALHAQLIQAGEHIGLATVYRNLQALVDLGDAESMRTMDGEIAYRHCSEGHHHHLICRKCGRTVEVSGDDLEAWTAHVAQQYGFTDAEHKVEIYGVCPDH